MKNKICCITFFLSLCVTASVMTSPSFADTQNVTLTIPLFFENRIPDDISEIETAADTLVYEKIGVNIRLVPMLRLVDTDTRRGTEMTLLERAGISFDLVHASMQDVALLDLTELLPDYGTEIVELFRQNGQDLLDGRDLSSLPSFSDYVGGQGIAMRKDLIEKYNIDLSALHTYDDFDHLFAQIAPLEPDMKMICSYSTGQGLLYRYGWNHFGGTIFCVSKEDRSLISNLYTLPEYKHLVSLFRSWYESGYIYEYSALQDIPASELVRAGTLFAYVCAYKPGIDAETSSNSGTDMVVVQTRPPIITDGSLARNCWGISASCTHPKEAMQFLNLLYTDRELVNLLSNGIEGIHYSVDTDGTVLPIDQTETKETEFLNDASWMLPNQFLASVRTGDDPLLWEKVDAYNRSALIAPNLGFVFDDTKVKKEKETLNEIAARYTYGLETGQLDPDIYLEEMMEKMRLAGEEKVYQELTRQYQEWLNLQEE